MRRRVWILTAAVLAALPLVDTILWQMAVRRLEAGLEAWATRGREAGFTVSHGRTAAGGWPLAATLTISDMAIGGGNPLLPGSASWRAPAVVLTVALSDPRFLEIEAEGTQHLRWPGLPDLEVTAGRLVAGTTLAAADESRDVELLITGLTVTTLGPGPIRRTSIARARSHVSFNALASAGDQATAGEPALQFTLDAAEIGLPDTLRWPLGHKVGALVLAGGVSGPLPTPRQIGPWVTAWRDGGGSMELRRVGLEWGPLNLTGSATLALDDQLQPMGAGSSHLTGYAATLDALAGSGALTRSAAVAAKAVLSLLAGTPAEGETPDVDVPLTLQFRTLSMRQVPLVRLPEVDWPGQ